MQRAIPRQQHTYRPWFSFAALSAFILAAPFVTGCAATQASTGDAKPTAMPVSVVKVRQADVPLTGEWVGTLDGYVNAQIQPQVSGYLVRQNYREGSAGSKGQVLFQIDPRPFQAAVDQAKGQVGAVQRGSLPRLKRKLGPRTDQS